MNGIKLSCAQAAQLLCMVIRPIHVLTLDAGKIKAVSGVSFTPDVITVTSPLFRHSIVMSVQPKNE